MEPDQPVHHPWIELTTTTNFEWSLPEGDSYTGPHGGPPFGLTQFMKDIVCSADNLALIFLAILPMSFFMKVALMTRKYCYEEWIVEKERIDENGTKKKRKYLADVALMSGGASTYERRHRAYKEDVRWDITPYYIISFLVRENIAAPSPVH
jgi:hypothetical protein